MPEQSASDQMRRAVPLTLEEMRRRYGERYRWLVLLTVLVGMIASIASSTIVNVAVPDMSRYFHLGQDRAQWISAGFMVSMTLALPLTPWLLQRYGLRRTYSGAAVLLMTGGVVGGLSRDFGLMIAARVAEGIAAGILFPIPNIVILRAFGPDERGRAMGTFGIGVVLAPAIGPAAGGLMVERLGWRSIFFFVVPFCLIALLMTRRFLPAVSSFIEEQRPLDWIGLAWLSASTLCVLNGVAGMHHMNAPSAWTLLGLGTLGFASLAVYQLLRRHPLLHVRLFAHRSFAMGSIVAFTYGIGLFGSTYLLPVFLQMALSYSPADAGLVLLPAGIALAMTMPLAGRLADRLRPSNLVVVGLLLLASALALTAGVTSTTSYLTLTVWVIVGRIGLGLVLPALSLGIVRGLATAEIPQAASMSGFVRQLGGAIGVSSVGIVLEWRLRAHGVGTTAREAVTAQGVAAFEDTFLFLAAVSAAAALAAWFMTPRARRQRP